MLSQYQNTGTGKGRRCWVPNCTNSVEGGYLKRFLFLPSSRLYTEIWIAVAGKPVNSVQDEICYCQDHFTEEETRMMEKKAFLLNSTLIPSLKMPEKVCRTCMSIIPAKDPFHILSNVCTSEMPPTIKTTLNFLSTSQPEPLYQILSFCIPELDLQLDPPSIICDECFCKIWLYFAFKITCIEVEKQLKANMSLASYGKMVLCRSCPQTFGTNFIALAEQSSMGKLLKKMFLVSYPANTVPLRVCVKCYNTLEKLDGFRMNCLEVEGKMKRHNMIAIRLKRPMLSPDLPMNKKVALCNNSKLFYPGQGDSQFPVDKKVALSNYSQEFYPNQVHSEVPMNATIDPSNNSNELYPTQGESEFPINTGVDLSKNSNTFYSSQGNLEFPFNKKGAQSLSKGKSEMPINKKVQNYNANMFRSNKVESVSKNVAHSDVSSTFYLNQGAQHKNSNDSMSYPNQGNVNDMGMVGVPQKSVIKYAEESSLTADRPANFTSDMGISNGSAKNVKGQESGMEEMQKKITLVRLMLEYGQPLKRVEDKMPIWKLICQKMKERNIMCNEHGLMGIWVDMAKNALTLYTNSGPLQYLDQLIMMYYKNKDPDLSSLKLNPSFSILPSLPNYQYNNIDSSQSSGKVKSKIYYPPAIENVGTAGTSTSTPQNLKKDIKNTRIKKSLSTASEESINKSTCTFPKDSNDIIIILDDDEPVAFTPAEARSGKDSEDKSCRQNNDQLNTGNDKMAVPRIDSTEVASHNDISNALSNENETREKSNVQKKDNATEPDKNPKTKPKIKRFKHARPWTDSQKLELLKLMETEHKLYLEEGEKKEIQKRRRLWIRVIERIQKKRYYPASAGCLMPIWYRLQLLPQPTADNKETYKAVYEGVQKLLLIEKMPSAITELSEDIAPPVLENETIIRTKSESKFKSTKGWTDTQKLELLKVMKKEYDSYVDGKVTKNKSIISNWWPVMDRLVAKGYFPTSSKNLHKLWTEMKRSVSDTDTSEVSKAVRKLIALEGTITSSDNEKTKAPNGSRKINKGKSKRGSPSLMNKDCKLKFIRDLTNQYHQLKPSLKVGSMSWSQIIRRLCHDGFYDGNFNKVYSCLSRLRVSAQIHEKDGLDPVDMEMWDLLKLHEACQRNYMDSEKEKEKSVVETSERVSTTPIKTRPVDERLPDASLNETDKNDSNVISSVPQSSGKQAKHKHPSESEKLEVFKRIKTEYNIMVKNKEYIKTRPWPTVMQRIANSGFKDYDQVSLLRMWHKMLRRATVHENTTEMTQLDWKVLRLLKSSKNWGAIRKNFKKKSTALPKPESASAATENSISNVTASKSNSRTESPDHKKADKDDDESIVKPTKIALAKLKSKGQKADREFSPDNKEDRRSCANWNHQQKLDLISIVTQFGSGALRVKKESRGIMWPIINAQWMEKGHHQGHQALRTYWYGMVRSAKLAWADHKEANEYDKLIIEFLTNIIKTRDGENKEEDLTHIDVESRISDVDIDMDKTENETTEEVDMSLEINDEEGEDKEGTEEIVEFLETNDEEGEEKEGTEEIVEFLETNDEEAEETEGTEEIVESLETNDEEAEEKEGTEEIVESDGKVDDENVTSNVEKESPSDVIDLTYNYVSYDDIIGLDTDNDKESDNTFGVAQLKIKESLSEDDSSDDDDKTIVGDLEEEGDEDVKPFSSAQDEIIELLSEDVHGDDDKSLDNFIMPKKEVENEVIEIPDSDNE